MKKLFALTLIVGLVGSLSATAQQDKSKRPSPPAKVEQTLASGAVISIDYSKPALKGRPLATLAPAGKVWRTGANEATIFETSKDVKIEGQTLPAGKYSLFSIPGDIEWVIIFDKKWQQWGVPYNQPDEALRVKVKPGKAPGTVEVMNFDIDKSGKVSLTWADTQVDFKVQ